MKKLLVTVIALAAVLMFVMPATATEVKLGGYYRVEGRTQSNPTLNEDTQSGSSAWRHRLRLTPAFIVSDALRFDFKTDIFDGTRFGTQSSEAKSTDSMDIDRLWMTITVPFGKFAVGRMAGGAWGLDFGNNNEDYDRIRFDTRIGKVSTGIILQKNVETDWEGNPYTTPDPQSDGDVDVYYLYGIYNSDFGRGGAVAIYVNNKANPHVDSTAYNILPYFDLKFGNLGLRGELKLATGENDPDSAAGLTTDTEELAYTLQADYAFGAFKVGGGYAYVQGEDADPLTKTATNLSTKGIGDDWDLFIIATDVDQIVNENDNALGILTTGVTMWYFDAEWKAHKDWTITARVGGFTADEIQIAGGDDKIGMEYDLDVSWAVMKNLKWRFTGGYFDAGDYFKSFRNAAGAASSITNIDNTYTLRHQLTLSF